MTDPTHVPLTPEETSALVQRAVRGGERRLRTRRIASSFAAVAVVAALGVGALSVLTLPGRAPIPASPPVSLSKAPETPTAPIPFDAGIQEGLETLLLDLPGVKAGPEEIADERPGGSYVAGGYLDADTPVTVTLSPVPLRDGDAKQVTSPPLLPEDSTFWELTDAASPDVQVWARERDSGFRSDAGGYPKTQLADPGAWPPVGAAGNRRNGNDPGQRSRQTRRPLRRRRRSQATARPGAVRHCPCPR